MTSFSLKTKIYHSWSRFPFIEFQLTIALTPNDARAYFEKKENSGYNYNPAALIIVVAVAMLVINILPTLKVGFLQDDYRLMDNTQAWGWNLERAIRQDGYTLGFRPLNMLQHTILWNLIGEQAVVHRLLRILIHLGFGGLIVYGVRLLGGSNLNIAVSLLLYFAATVTRDTISYWVMFSPSDILALGALVVMLAGVTKGWSPSKLGLSTLVVSALAIYSKENGIAASGGVLLLTLIFWRRLTMRHRLWIVLTQALLMLTYIPAYRSFTAGKWMTLSEFSPESAQVQGMFVLKGIVISLSGPFSAIYLNLRGEALSQLAAITITIVVAIVFAWFLWIAYERDRNQLFVALCSRFWLGVVVALLVIGFLLPYVPGRWFGSRMLVGTVALGAALWGLIIGDALQAWANRLDGSNWGQFNRGLGFVVILAALGAGTPIDAHIRGEMATTAALRAVVQEAQAKGFTDICLVGFGTKGSFLRKRNARGVIGYESKRQVAAHSFETRAEIPDALQCVVVTYDEAVIKLGPLVVEWSDRSDLHSSSIP